MEPYILEFANLAKGFEPQIKALWYDLLDICVDKLGKLGLQFQKAECNSGPDCRAEFSVQKQGKWVRKFHSKSETTTLYYKGKGAENLISLAEGHFRPVEQHYMSSIFAPANNPIVLEYKEAVRNFNNKLLNFHYEAEKLGQIACELYNDLMPLFSLFGLTIPPCAKAFYDLYMNDTSYLFQIFITPPGEDIEPLDEIFGLTKNSRVSVWGPSVIRNSRFYKTICDIIKEKELLQEILKNPEEFKDLVKELLI